MLPLQHTIARGVYEMPFRCIDGNKLMLVAVNAQGHCVGWERAATAAEYAHAHDTLARQLDMVDPPVLRLLGATTDA